MYSVLQQKKHMVIDCLINVLGHKNQSNVEDSLNATQILLEMIELEKTFELFMGKQDAKVGKIMDLAIDSSN